MNKKTYFYEPSKGHGLAHNPFNAIIAPRPIGWISSISADGQANLAPYSFFNAFNYTPPIIGFSSIGYKDTVSNIKQTGVFCWNLVSQHLAEKMNITATNVDPDIDEFVLAGLEKKQARCIDVPYVADSLVVMECKLTQLIQLQDNEGQDLDTYMVMGEVVGVHIDQACLTEDVFSTVNAQPLLRGGGAGDYFTVSSEQQFDMRRHP